MIRWIKQFFDKTEKGLIYTVVGHEKYSKLAVVSAQSVKKYNPELPITLFCDKQYKTVDYSLFDEVILIDREPYLWSNRMKAMLRSPYKKTLYLDADSYILDDIEDMFVLLDKFDYAIAHGGNRIKRHYNAIKDVAVNKSIPYAFAPLGGGTQLIRKNKKTQCFLKNLLKTSIEKNYYDDQVSIRELLRENSCKLKFYILPMEFRIGQLTFIEIWGKGINSAIPKIFFYTQTQNNSTHKNNIEKAIEITKNIKKTEGILQ